MPIDKSQMSIHHHMLVVVSRNKRELFDLCGEKGFLQFAFSYHEGIWTMSAPLTAAQRDDFVWLYEKHRKESNTE